MPQGQDTDPRIGIRIKIFRIENTTDKFRDIGNFLQTARCFVRVLAVFFDHLPEGVDYSVGSVGRGFWISSGGLSPALTFVSILLVMNFDAVLGMSILCHKPVFLVKYYH
jgi:hypothetical protein